ncbi:hypothetical protein PM082_015465 [Marasmius tenuissimus]|nr:hypothetical protein PM082_015465 [Marasmius tenuissimus]
MVVVVGALAGISAHSPTLTETTTTLVLPLRKFDFLSSHHPHECGIGPMNSQLKIPMSASRGRERRSMVGDAETHREPLVYIRPSFHPFKMQDYAISGL